MQIGRMNTVELPPYNVTSRYRSKIIGELTLEPIWKISFLVWRFDWRPEPGKGEKCSLVMIAAYCIVLSRIFWCEIQTKKHLKTPSVVFACNAEHTMIQCCILFLQKVAMFRLCCSWHSFRGSVGSIGQGDQSDSSFFLSSRDYFALLFHLRNWYFILYQTTHFHCEPAWDVVVMIRKAFF